jgi:tetratricopeptide (TPR) repeat protein
MTVPVIGLVQVGAQSMADRYTYLPLIGVAVALTFGISIPNTFPRLGRAMRIALPSLILAGCLVGTGIQLRHWRDSESLFNHALAVTEENSVAHSNLAKALLQIGRQDEASVEFQRVVEIDPQDAETWGRLGMIYFGKHHLPEATESFDRVLELQPDNVQVLNDSAWILANLSGSFRAERAQGG